MSNCNRVKFVLLFEGTGNSASGNPSAISKIRWFIPEQDELRYVSLVDGSGLHGATQRSEILTSVDGSDWDKIIGKHYDNVTGELVKRGIGVEDVDFFMFGFSRGAYQAKIFANAICKYGLSKTTADLIQCLKNGTPPSKSEQRDGDRVVIKYMGLIDTVCETSQPPHGMENPGIPGSVYKVRHAVALNEYREHFKPQLLLPKEGSQQIDEQAFIGCHSDVGWAYDRTSGLRLWEYMAGWFSNKPNKIPTKGLGKIVLQWILDDVVTPLSVNVDALGNGNPSAFDYSSLLVFFPFIIHNSYKEASNFKCMTSKRDLSGVVPHHSVRGVKEILRSQIFDLSKIEVEQLIGRGAIAGERSEFGFRECLIELLEAKGGLVCIPSSLAHDDEKMIGRQYEELARAIRTNHFKIFRLLSDSNLIEHSWREEMNCLAEYLMGCFLKICQKTQQPTS